VKVAIAALARLIEIEEQIEQQMREAEIQQV
jgi:hypothetical protein